MIYAEGSRVALPEVPLSLRHLKRRNCRRSKANCRRPLRYTRAMNEALLFVAVGGFLDSAAALAKDEKVKAAYLGE